jgi:D-alanyl-lipoteichoic acid acyltransferase DltB (MBOAT superfamily)
VLFNSLSFLLFFSAFYLLFHFVLRRHDHKLWLIAIGSVVFYGTWSYKFIPFLLGMGMLDFFVAHLIARETNERRKKAWLTLSVVANLAVLAIVKYTHFFLQAAADGLRVLGLHRLTVPAWDIVVPLGISFYTFQSLSYTIDVYRGLLAPRRRPHEFVASLTFFPHLIAGPIVRSSFLLPQFETLSPPDRQEVERGLVLVGAGLAKKTIADLLGPVVVQVFGAPHAKGPLESWTSALAFTAQIYGDFAGYTDIATGISLLLGFTLPPNFQLPYLSTSPLDFWRRWHMSLSTWLRDYLFQPLAMTNRRHPYVNLVITMVLAGLWHGPRWSYLAFGLYWGLLIALTQYLLNVWPDRWNVIYRLPLVRAGQVLFTFYLTVIGCVLFRAPTLSRAGMVLRAMHQPGPIAFTRPALLTLVLVLGALVSCHLLDYLVLHRPTLSRQRWIWWPIAAAGIAFALAFGRAGQSFIYFQF